MKASELRIGNLVNDFNVLHPIEKYVEVVTISPTPICVKNTDGNYKINIAQLQGIPLTEEWLLKFGFSKEYNQDEKRESYYLNDCDDSYYIDFDLDYNGWYLGATCYGYLKDTESVHQLQNLYFALTNEELTIK